VAESNAEIVRRVFEAFQEGLARGDPGAVFDSPLVAPEAEWIIPPNTPGFREVYRGREEFREFIRTWTEDFDWSIELESVEEVGADLVVAVFHQRATGMASGVPVELHMALLDELEGGRVVRFRNFLDPKEALKAAKEIRRPSARRG
jgi:ketosteroid isomerase-like protein